MRSAGPAMRKLTLHLISVLFFLCWCFPSIAGSASSHPPGDQLVRVSVLDVGQGDAIVIQSPNDKAVLIDAGPADGFDLLTKQLQLLGISHFDLIIATHPHEDHIGGIAPLLDTVTAGLFSDSGIIHTTATYEKMVAKLREKGIKTRKAHSKQSYKLYEKSDTERLDLEILGPREPFIGAPDPQLNQNSVVTMLRYKQFKMLLTGDGEVETEERLLADGLESADVLKVGHHGSKTSTSPPFLERVHPLVAVISCGAHNDYGHPHPKTIRAFEEANVRVFRTDQAGQVRVLTDGNQVWVETFSRDSLKGAVPGTHLNPTSVVGPIALSSADEALEVDLTSGSKQDEKKSAQGDTQTEQASEAGSASDVSPETAPFVASKSSKVFHKVSCGNARRISKKNRRYFMTREEAMQSKRPAKCCKP